MASVSSSNSRKRKQDSVATPEPPAKSSRVNLLNPSHLLQLEIPAVTNTSLPVWDAARSQQVDTTWTINPYCINVHLTPAVPNEPVAATSSGKGNRRSKRKCSVAQTPAPTYNILQPQTIVQTLTQQQGPPQNTSYVLLTNPQSSTPLLASSQQKILVNAPLTDSINVSLPVIIAQLQPALQAGVPAKKPTFPTIQTLMVTPVKPKAAPKALSSFSFHTRTSAVQICDEFLLNLCRAGQNCELHHTPYPFHWQLWCVTSQQWVDFPPHSQVLLERMYSNVNQSSICIKDGSHRLSLIFDTMLMSDTSKYSGVRRLTNSECLTRNPYFPSNYKIYWLNYPEWHEYNQFISLQEVSTLLKQKMTDGIYECTFTVGSQKYRVNFTTMTQTNIATGSQREVRLRPAYRSPESMRPYLQTGIQSESSESIGDPPAANFSVDPLKEFSFWYPPVWSPVFGQDYTLVDVPPGTLAFKTVQSFFNESLPETAVDIISIQQVQNLLLWDKYQRQKVFMQKRHTKSKEPLERHLFHGTTKKAAEDICHNNFDPRVAGVNGTSFGRGSYFATKASISSVYSVLSSGDEVHHMFLAKVLVGQVCLGRANYRRPPPLSSRSRQYLLYDTCVDRMDKPTMFVVFDSCQCYPYYLIRYKTLPGEVEI